MQNSTPENANVNITLIPGSGIQFWNLQVAREKLKKSRCHFWEEKIGTYENGDPKMLLHVLVEDEATGELVNPDTNGPQPIESECYKIGYEQVRTLLLDQWVPMPCFGIRRNGTVVEYDKGPNNWVRGRLTESETSTQAMDGVPSATMTLVFDTAIGPDDDEDYNAPRPQDQQARRQFAFMHELTRLSGFLDTNWVSDWLENLLLEYKAANKSPYDNEDPHGPSRTFEHYAIYLTLLHMLADSGQMPTVRLLNDNEGVQVDVDLVLDLGNSRSCGILIETFNSGGGQLSNSYALALRDMSQPEFEYTEPFSSRVEFTQLDFGSEIYSRRSGRSNAFAWPSPIRTGQEAVRLMGARDGTEGNTGLSSPKRYLWDTQAQSQGWRFNNSHHKGVDGRRREDPPVNGRFRTMMTKLKQFRPLRSRPNEADPTALINSGPATYSRSLLFTFMLTELILQANMQMNAPHVRMKRKDADRSRRLRSIIMTMPPGMPVAEQQIFRARAQQANALAWQMLKVIRGEDSNASFEEPDADARRQDEGMPSIELRLDEATATQIVWLHNEIVERLGGNSEQLFDLYARKRPLDLAQARSGAAPEESLRIASLDIGGGTTDLMVATYRLTGGSSLLPSQDFRESFTIAGDDVVQRIIAHIVLEPVKEALRVAGVAEAEAVISTTLGNDQGNQSETDRHLRRLFVTTILEPMALRILKAYESAPGEPPPVQRFDAPGFLCEDHRPQWERAIDYLATYARRAGAQGFDFMKIEIVPRTEEIEAAIYHTLGAVIDPLVEVIWHYDCDILLVSGRPSRLRKAMDIVIDSVPLPPHRIVAMHDYQVGAQYPFRNPQNNRIDDPKTTVVVGTALYVQAERKALPHFTMNTTQMQMRSTARFIGKLDRYQKIEKNPRDPDAVFDNFRVETPDGENPRFVIKHVEGTTFLGFRQLDLVRWNASPLYVLEFTQPGSGGRQYEGINDSYTVTLERDDEGEDAAVNTEASMDEVKRQMRDAEHFEMARENFRVVEVTNRGDERRPPSTICLRLQTIMDEQGYWRDTGQLEVG